MPIIFNPTLIRPTLPHLGICRLPTPLYDALRQTAVTEPDTAPSRIRHEPGYQVMEPPEIIEVDPDTETIGCDGGNGPLGHPLVYYSFGTRDQVDCGYCGRRFMRRKTSATAA